MLPRKDIHFPQARTKANCPVCGVTCEAGITVSSEVLTQAYTAYYGTRPDMEAVTNDYEMLTCSHCGLEFANPLSVPSGFYPWVTKQAEYYPLQRVEWYEVLDRVSQSGGAGTLLEIGCGTGSFLRLAKANSSLSHIAGIDITEESVASCRKHGVEAHVGDCRQIWEKRQDFRGAFDWVVGFHLLEHVPDPCSLIADSLSFLRPGGRACFSTPLSPNEHERQCFDPLLYPPHHLTRWNVSSIQMLAERAGAEASIHVLEHSGWLRGTSRALFCRLKSERRNYDLRGRIVYCLTRPKEFIREALWQAKRPRIAGTRVSNHVLVEFRKV